MNKKDLYQGEGCLVEVVVGSCAPEGFKKLEEKTEDATTEKHVPYVEEHENGYVVKVGKETEHPMTDEHYIQYIEILVDDDRLYRKYLKPGDKPVACFEVVKGEKVVAREYCNLHGIWKY